jgi:hypothetical protein
MQNWRFRLFLILSGPGRLWVWLCGVLCGVEVEGRIEEA